ncbi:MAG: hypothetical protein A2684_03000 [Candidatus Levybacteria bacterium RIFCSPHIGHO2_01_FULL_36_15b]|nr:MAG: hypothetical protein A2684_03000 [Candidatus Levybacteria bacterium RIFCSPHIGHO2_01_FULL_36_15b]
MLDPYRMIVVNLALLTVLGGCILFYKLFFKNKKINLFYILIFLAIISSISIFRTGAYESGDFNIHIYRSMEFYRSLSEGIIMPSWAANLNATFGYPLFIFNYSLPYYFISALHFIGLSFINSLKVFLAANLVLSALFMYIFVQNKFKNDLASFASGVFYLFFPYHLISVHFKVTIGEILAFTLIPLLFLFLDKFTRENKNYFLVLSGIILGLVALSHIFISIFLIPIIFMYSWSYKTKTIIAFKIILIGLLMSSYQWAPSLIFNSVLFTSKYPIDINTIYFPSISDLIYSPWRYGLLFQGPKGEISYLLGYAELIIIGLTLFLSIKNKFSVKYNTQIQFFLGLLFMLVLLMIPTSRNVWDAFPLLGAAGPHRLLIPLGFIIALLSSYIAILVRDKKWIYILIAFAVLTTLLNWGQRRVIPEINDKILEKNISLSTYLGESHFYANTKYVNPKHPWFSNIPKNKIETIKGKASFSSGENNSALHIYRASISQVSLISEKTLYFPGWKAYANGKPINIFPGKEGEINFILPKGDFNLMVFYKDEILFRLVKIISITSLLLGFIYLFRSFKFHKSK